MSPGDWIALGALAVAVVVPLGSYLAARAGAAAGVRVHLDYLRRDVDAAARSVRAAHWRLDEVGAPPAPMPDR